MLPLEAPMRISLKRFKDGRLLPVVATLVSVLLLTGQFFACCRMNEEFAATLVKVLSRLASPHLHSHDNQEPEAGESRHTCHGHGRSVESVVAATPEGISACSVAAKEECLSEHAFSRTPMLVSELDVPVLATLPVPISLDAIQPEPYFESRPRPQNKSSPPLYLTTLRILI